jgi:hypothetical protein
VSNRLGLSSNDITVRLLVRCPRIVVSTWLALSELVLAGVAAGRSTAITFDDGPDIMVRTRLTPESANAALLKALADAHLKAIRFVTRTASDPNRNALNPQMLPKNGLARRAPWRNKGVGSCAYRAEPERYPWCSNSL